MSASSHLDTWHGAACGKDPGFSPHSILEHAHRSSRYSEDELSALAFEGPPPKAADLSRQWHAVLEAAGLVVARLPAAQVGQAVLTTDGRLFTGDLAALEQALADEHIAFHPGRIGGAVPQLKA